MLWRYGMAAAGAGEAIGASAAQLAVIVVGLTLTGAVIIVFGILVAYEACT